MHLEVRPRDAYVLIERRQVATAGLVLPERMSEATKEAMYTFHVAALGPKVEDADLLGARVLIRPNSAALRVPDSSNRALVLEDEIVAVLGEETA